MDILLGLFAGVNIGALAGAILAANSRARAEAAEYLSGYRLGVQHGREGITVLDPDLSVSEAWRRGMA